MTFWLLASLYVLAAMIACAIFYVGADRDRDGNEVRRGSEGRGSPGAAGTDLRGTILRFGSPVLAKPLLDQAVRDDADRLKGFDFV